MPDSIVSLGSSLPGAFTAQGPGLDLRPGSRKDDPAKIHQAAQQFESLLMSQILKGAHGEDEGWLGTGDDPAASSAMGIAEEQFAQALSARGGLGLASLIEKGLTKSTNATDR